MEENEKNDAQMYYGGAVKALGDGRVGGYLVRFTTDSDPDLEEDFFTKYTDLGVADGSSLPVYYQHGMDKRVKNKRIGRGPVRSDDVGLWIEAQLELRDKYEQAIYKLAQDGKLGWSSGAAGHLVSAENVGKSRQITAWPIAEASLTPTPAEPRNSAMPIKSIEVNPLMVDEPTDAQAEAAQDGEKPDATKTTQMENTKMEITEEKLNELVNSAVKTAIEAQPKEEPVSVEDAVAAGVERAMKNLPAKNTNVEVTKDEGDQPFASDGEFFQAVKTAAIYHDEDVRLRPLKATGLSENVPADGGYLLTPQNAGGIIERMYTGGQLLSRVSTDQIGPNSNSMLYNAVDESSRADGSRWGGVLGYWTAEAGTKTASKPTFREMELKLKKVAALCYATDELLADATALQSWLFRTVPEELRFQVENAFYRGNGVGKPLGIMNSPCLVSVLRIDANEIDATDIANMYARRWAGVSDYVWLANPSIFPQLINLTVGNFPILMPISSGAQGDPSFSIYGKPYIEIEHTSALGTTGDLMLASLSQYQTIAKGGVQSASSIHVQFITDETAFRFIYRVDGQPLWNSALTPKDAGNTLSPFVVLTAATA